MEKMIGSMRKGTKDYLMQTVVKSLIEGMTQISIERPKDPHLWMGNFFLNKSGNVDHIVLLDGSIIDSDDGTRCRVEDAGVVVPQGSAISAARRLKESDLVPSKHNTRGELEKKCSMLEKKLKDLQSELDSSVSMNNQLIEQVSALKSDNLQNQINRLCDKLESTNVTTHILQSKVDEQARIILDLTRSSQSSLVSPTSISQSNDFYCDNKLSPISPKSPASKGDIIPILVKSIHNNNDSNNNDNDNDYDYDNNNNDNNCKNKNTFKKGKKVNGVHLLFTCKSDGNLNAFSHSHNQSFKITGAPSMFQSTKSCERFINSLELCRHTNGTFSLIPQSHHKANHENANQIKKYGIKVGDNFYLTRCDLVCNQYKAMNIDSHNTFQWEISSKNKTKLQKDIESQMKIK